MNICFIYKKGKIEKEREEILKSPSHHRHIISNSHII